jgi:hypothetical protein
MRKFYAMPMAGYLGSFTPRATGVPQPTIMYLTGVILEPGDPPVTGAKSLAEHKREHWDASISSLRIDVGPNVFTIGPDVLNGIPDQTQVALTYTFVPARTA